MKGVIISLGLGIIMALTALSCTHYDDDGYAWPIPVSCESLQLTRADKEGLEYNVTVPKQGAKFDLILGDKSNAYPNYRYYKIECVVNHNQENGLSNNEYYGKYSLKYRPVWIGEMQNIKIIYNPKENPRKLSLEIEPEASPIKNYFDLTIRHMNEYLNIKITQK